MVSHSLKKSFHAYVRKAFRSLVSLFLDVYLSIHKVVGAAGPSGVRILFLTVSALPSLLVVIAWWVVCDSMHVFCHSWYRLPCSTWTHRVPHQWWQPHLCEHNYIRWQSYGRGLWSVPCSAHKHRCSCLYWSNCCCCPGSWRLAITWAYLNEHAFSGDFI